VGCQGQRPFEYTEYRCALSYAGAQSLSAAVHFIAPPPEEQEDHAQNGELLQHAGTDGQHDSIFRIYSMSKPITTPL